MRTLGDIEVITYEAFDAVDGVTHVVTGRHGGVSTAPYASLNLARQTGDTVEHITRNRERLAEALGTEAARLTFGSQVHRSQVAVVEAGDEGSVFPDTDALVTDLPDVPLVILVADCAVIGLYDIETGAVGIAHAGWRGTLDDIGTKTIHAMGTAYGSQPRNLVAAIGPSIGPCCYEVGPEVADAFFASHPEIADEILSSPDFASAGSFEGVNEGRMMLDLWQANAMLLERAGVPADRIEVAELCTSCNRDRFFSHRAERGHTGRFAGVIMRNGATRRPY